MEMNVENMNLTSINTQMRLVREMARHYDKLMTHQATPDVADRFWKGLAKRVKCPQYDSPSKLRQLFEEAILPNFIKVLHWAATRKEALLLYPACFDQLYDMLAHRECLERLGLNSATDEGVPIRNLEIAMAREEFARKIGPIAIDARDRAPEPSLPLAGEELEPLLPYPAARMIQLYPQIEENIRAIYIRTKAEKEQEMILWEILETVTNCWKRPPQFDWATDENLSPIELWKQVSLVMENWRRDNDFNVNQSSSLEWQRYWFIFNKSIDHFVSIASHVEDEKHATICYPTIYGKLRRMRLIYSLGLDKKRCGVIIAIQKRGQNEENLPCSEIRRIHELWMNNKPRLGWLIRGYPMTGGKPMIILIRRMEFYQSWPGKMEQIEQLLCCLKNYHDAIVASPSLSPTGRDNVWAEIAIHLQRISPRFVEAHTKNGCKAIFKRAMIDTLLVRFWMPTEQDGCLFWPLYSLCCCFIHKKFVQQMGINQQFYRIMEELANPNRNLTSELHQSIRLGFKINELESCFFCDI